jgi:hypothetical protein
MGLTWAVGLVAGYVDVLGEHCTHSTQRWRLHNNTVLNSVLLSNQDVSVSVGASHTS